MFHFTRRQRRRWSLPLMAVMLLHWCLGFGAAVADVICLETNGQAVLELGGTSCAKPVAHKSASKTCVDLALDDGHASHEPAPSSDAKPSLPLVSPLLLALLPTIDLSLVTASSTNRWQPPPFFANQPVQLRATTVLLI